MGVSGILGGNLGVHIIKFPSGKFGFVGSVPKVLGTPQVANTADIMGGRAYRDNNTGESMVVKFPSFNSGAEAVAYAKSKGVSAKLNEDYQPKTGQACSCKPGQQRDNCPSCEGTGQRIDFKAIRAKNVVKEDADKKFNTVSGPAAKTKAPYSSPGMPNNWQAGFGPGSDLQIAGGGSEVPFLKGGRWVLYVWEPKTGRKGLYDYGTDIVDWDNSHMENTNLTKLVESVQKRDFHTGNEAFAGLMREKVEAALAKIRPGVKMNEDYNGWKNRQTWNVALWIGNDEGLYNLAREIVRSNPENPYNAFVQEVGSSKTPDNVAWNDSGLDIDALDDMMRELIESKKAKGTLLAEGESFGVECMECGKKFKTKSMVPSCPKCGGSDIDMPTDKGRGGSVVGGPKGDRLEEAATDCPGCGKPFVGVYNNSGSDAQRKELRCKSCGATQTKK